jgi:D-serine dehydratase
MMDQHLFLEVGGEVDVRPGDLVAFGLSHPCTAFDKMRLLPVIDDDLNVVDAVLTEF